MEYFDTVYTPILYLKKKNTLSQFYYQKNYRSFKNIENLEIMVIFQLKFSLTYELDSINVHTALCSF